MFNLKGRIAFAAGIFVVLFSFRMCTGGPGYLATANLVQGLSTASEVKIIVNEHWAMMGELPCTADELGLRKTLGRASSVLAAIDVTDCGQITLLYNEDSGLSGRRMVMEAREVEGLVGVELAWDCWTPDFKNIQDRVPQCRYEDRELAAIVAAEENDEIDNQTALRASESATMKSTPTKSSCKKTAAIYRPVFSPGSQHEQMTFSTVVIGARGRRLQHRWFFDDIAVGEFSFSIESNRWPTSSSRSMSGLEDGEFKVEVYDGACLIGKAKFHSGEGSNASAGTAGGWMRPKQALETTLAKTRVDYASEASRSAFVDDLTENGDTLLLAAIRRGDTAEVLKLVNRVEVTKEQRREMSNEELGRHYRRADPFLRDANGISPINLAHQLGHVEIVEALIQAAITIEKPRRKSTTRERWDDNLIRTLTAGEGGLTRFDDGDTPLLRAVRTNNERAVLSMLHLPGWNDLTGPYRPPVDLYAFDPSGKQALAIARLQGFYAIERFLSLAMTRKSPGWAVSRDTFATRMKGSEPGDCRDAAFADEEVLYYFTELTDMDGERVAHEWYFDDKLVMREEFDGAGKRRRVSSKRQFSPADVGLWDVRVVTDSGEILRTGRLHYQEVTDYNTRNRKNFIAPCNMGIGAIYSLVEAQAPISELKYLIEKGAPLKPDGSSAKDLIARAIDSGNIPFLEWFLARGLDVNSYVKSASTPLMLASKNGDGAMALFLITRGADVRFKRFRDDRSALQVAAANNKAELVEILLEHGADPNTRDKQGFTALHNTVSRCNLPATLSLLGNGADPGVQSSRGESPMDIVSKCDRVESWDMNHAGLSALYSRS